MGEVHVGTTCPRSPKSNPRTQGAQEAREDHTDDGAAPPFKAQGITAVGNGLGR